MEEQHYYIINLGEGWEPALCISARTILISRKGGGLTTYPIARLQPEQVKVELEFSRLVDAHAHVRKMSPLAGSKLLKVRIEESLPGWKVDLVDEDSVYAFPPGYGTGEPGKREVQLTAHIERGLFDLQLNSWIVSDEDADHELGLLLSFDTTAFLVNDQPRAMLADSLRLIARMPIPSARS